MAPNLRQWEMKFGRDGWISGHIGKSLFPKLIRIGRPQHLGDPNLHIHLYRQWEAVQN